MPTISVSLTTAQVDRLKEALKDSTTDGIPTMDDIECMVRRLLSSFVMNYEVGLATKEDARCQR